MAAFEKGPGSRRFYKLVRDPFPTSPGGIPSGSITENVGGGAGDGNRFIYNGDTGEWLPFEGVEDANAILEEIRDSIQELLPHTRIMRAALATLANDQCDTSYSTDDE